MTNDEERELLTENIARLDAAIEEMNAYRVELAAALAAITTDPVDPDNPGDPDGPGTTV